MTEIIEQKKNEKTERQRIESFWWAGMLIWAGLIFATDSLGFLPQIGEADAWSWIFLGAGLSGSVGNIFRTSSLGIPNPTAWDWIWGSIFLLFGVGGFTTLNLFWPLILILIGAVILVNGLLRRE